VKASKAVSLVFLIILSLCLVDTQPVMSQSSGTIYIRSDGSVDPPTAPIQRDENVYTLTDNIIDYFLVVQRDNIVIDGAGYTLEGTGSGTGIRLTDRTNVTIKNVKIQYFSVGIALDGSYYNAISGNNITHNDYQASIFVFGNSSNNKITNNNIEANNVNGIWLNSSSNNIISENKIKANGFEGIIVSGGSNNSISGNVIERNNGDGIYLAADSSSITVTENYIKENNPNGILLLYSSSNTISTNTLKNNYRGVYLDASSNNTIVVNNIKANYEDGIYLYNSSNNTVIGNIIYNNGYTGVALWFSSNNTVDENIITSNAEGVRLQSSCNNNTVSGNDIKSNKEGVYIVWSSDNRIYHNNFINNTQEVHFYESGHANIWDNGEEGNYWDNYTGIDSDGDGIGDTPYIISENNIDRYPLMKPAVILDPPKDLPIPDPTQMLVVAVVAIVLAIIVSLAFYRRKKRVIQ
jgi:parallel beta-helix repeat protein